MLLLTLFSIGILSCNTASSNKDEKDPCKEATLLAIADAERGEYALYSYGYPVVKDWDYENFHETFLFDKYHIKTGNQGCVIFLEDECYGDKMRQLIYQEFGKDIFTKTREESKKKYLEIVQEKIDTGFLFSMIDSFPKFHHGVDSLSSFFSLNIKLKPDACIEGKVYVSIVVEKDGSVHSPEILKGIDEYLDSEVLRVIPLLPKFQAGYHYGQKVRVRMILPVTFK